MKSAWRGGLLRPPDGLQAAVLVRVRPRTRPCDVRGRFARMTRFDPSPLGASWRENRSALLDLERPTFAFVRTTFQNTTSPQEPRLVRQHSIPLFLSAGVASAVPLTPLSKQNGHGAVNEADIQALVHAHPACLPIAEIDPMFAGPVPICTELNTPAGAIDNFMVTPSGLPIIVECKLWRNPEGRRELVGQILDYAKELSRWSSSDLQREVKRRLKCDGDPLFDMVRAVDPKIDETQFNDALTANLRRGRCLLLIVGDGLREGVEAIAEYLHVHAGLHFSLGLVELPIYVMPDGSRLVAPRVIARTTVITRTVVELPEGYVLQEPQDSAPAADIDPDRAALADEQEQFWKEFLAHLMLDDPEQVIPAPARLGYLRFALPAERGSSWLNVYRDWRRNEVGLFLSSHRNSAGEYAMQAIASDWDAVKNELGGTAKLVETDPDRPRIVDSKIVGPLAQAEVRKRGFAWLAERANTFVNVLRPRVRTAAADYQSRSD